MWRQWRNKDSVRSWSIDAHNSLSLSSGSCCCLIKRQIPTNIWHHVGFAMQCCFPDLVGLSSQFLHTSEQSAWSDLMLTRSDAVRLTENTWKGLCICSEIINFFFLTSQRVEQAAVAWWIFQGKMWGRSCVLLSLYVTFLQIQTSKYCKSLAGFNLLDWIVLCMSSVTGFSSTVCHRCFNPLQMFGCFFFLYVE